MFSIAVLGPLEVRRNGAPVPVPAGKSAELLVRLALEAGTAVRTDRLVDDLWADEAVRTRRNTLQSKVTRLRRALGDPAAIVTTDDGYRLDVDRDDVDALAVLDQASTAVALLERRRRSAARSHSLARRSICSVATGWRVRASGPIRIAPGSTRLGSPWSRPEPRPGCGWARSAR